MGVGYVLHMQVLSRSCLGKEGRIYSVQVLYRQVLFEGGGGEGVGYILSRDGVP